MRTRHAFVVLFAATLVCGFGIAAGADAIVSGPQVGSKLPGGFQPVPLNVTNAESPSYAGKRNDYIEQFGAGPVVLVFGRGINDPLTNLLKKLDAEVGKNKAARLTTLDLSENDLQFEDEDAQALAACEYLAGLTSLDLGHDNIGIAGAEALASSPHLGRLTSLRLWHNYIEPAGVRAVASSRSLGRLTSLDLGGDWIGDAGAEALVESFRLMDLAKLDLSGNGIGDVGAKALAGSPHLWKLGRLDLSYNNIGEATRAALRAQFGDRIRL